MCLVGVCYLFFENDVLSSSKSAQLQSTSATRARLSRTILGIQVKTKTLCYRWRLADWARSDWAHTTGNGCDQIECRFSTKQTRLTPW